MRIRKEKKEKKKEEPRKGTEDEASWPLGRSA